MKLDELKRYLEEAEKVVGGDCEVMGRGHPGEIGSKEFLVNIVDGVIYLDF